MHPKKSKQHRERISASMREYWKEKRKTDLLLANHNSKNDALVSLASSRDIFRQTFLNLNAGRIRSILDSVETGYLRDWMEFAEIMVEQDGHLQGLVNKRTGAISSKELKIEPGEQTQEARAAAEFVKQALDQIPDFDRALRHLLHATFTGVSAIEVLWERGLSPAGLPMFKPTGFLMIPGKRLGITQMHGSWQYYLDDWGRFEADEFNPVFRFPEKFIIHSPGDNALPHYRGLLRPLAFTFFFKKLGKTYWLGGAEKYSFPSIYAQVPTATQDNVRSALLNDLFSLANDGSAVINQDVDIKTINAAATSGDVVWRSLLQYFDTEMSKLILGGTLAVEASSGAGGNRALGEVHERSQQHIIDGDARGLAEAIRFSIIKQLIQKNLHLFGGIMPPLPGVKFDVTARDPIPIGQLHIQAQAVTINEMRKELGLSPVAWGNERAMFGAAVAPTEAPAQTTSPALQGEALNAPALAKPSAEDAISIAEEDEYFHHI